VVVAAGRGQWGALMPVEPQAARVGSEAPDFTLPSPGRGSVRLSDYRHERAVLLVFMRAFG
jgi:peroxiredoxin